jgi:DNA/RNA-binding domain of Phe-tRNA-synthetase-like protein
MSRMLVATDAWRSTFPGAVVGALVMRGVHNPARSKALEAEKRRLEERLRSAAGGSEVVDVSGERVLRAYVDYYRARGKNYLVQAQRESVARKGKQMPSRAALVEAMFMAEPETLILTAGHDLNAVAPPLRVDVTADGDRYVLLDGTEGAVRRGDMMMSDSVGIVSSVLRGPDQRTRITAETHDVLFAAYAPAGIGEDVVRGHLEQIHAHVHLLAPEAQIQELTTLTAG